MDQKKLLSCPVTSWHTVITRHIVHSDKYRAFTDAPLWGHGGRRHIPWCARMV